LGYALLLLAALLFGSRLGYAQVDTYGFAASTGTFTPLGAGATVITSINSDDAVSPALPIGFNFVFDGTTFTQVYANSNGFLSFNAATPSSGSYTNNFSTVAATYRPFVAPYWDDLTGAGGTASYQTTGTAGSRVFTFEWLNWRRLSASGPQLSFQVQLVEGSNVVRFVYRVEATAMTGASVSIGLAGTGTGNDSFLSLSDATAAPTVSSTVSTNTIDTVPATGQVYTFTPPAPSPCPTPRGLTASNITATTATVSYTVTNTTPGPFTILYGPTGFNPNQPSTGTNVYTTVTATGTSTTLTGLTPQTGYQFYVRQNCGGTNGNSALSNAGVFTTNPNPAANDECSAAVALTVGASCSPTTGTVFGATQSLAPSTGCGGTVANDVWYSFVANSSALQLTTTSQFGGFYDVRSGACAATTSVQCGTNGGSAILSGLTTGQTYYVRIYSSTTTPPTAATSGFTLCVSTISNYCNTGLGGVCGGNNITAVSIAGTTLNATGLTCTTASGQSYTAYPATGANTATLNSGTPYQLSVTVDPGSSVSVWIDSNHNLVFEASEHIQVATNTVGTAPVVATINLPTNAVQGPTGLRVRSRVNGSPNGPTDACTNFGSGETKDFTITVGPPAACPTASNVAVSSITSTSASLGFTTTGSATSYTLTLTPQNGTPSTRTVTTSPVALTGLAPNTTYTVTLVSNCSGSTTSSPVTVTFTTTPVPATNDECTTAVALTVNATCTSPTTGTVLGATQSLAPSTACTGTTAFDVWYSFVATSNSHTINFTPQFAGVIDVRSGACAATTSVFCATAGANATINSNVGSLTVGQTYFVRVYTSSATQPAASASSFTLCVTPGPATPANDDCAGAINVPVQFGTCVGQVSADNTAATGSTGVPAPTCASYSGGDLWFKVTVPASGSVTVETVPPTAGSPITDTGMSIYSGACSSLTQISCDDDSSPNGLFSLINVTGRTPGEVLYIRVWEYGNNTTGLIAVCVTTPSNCAAPTGPTATNVTNTTAQLNWIAPAGTPAGTFEIEYGQQGFTPGTGTVVTGLTASTYQLTNLNANTAYCFYVRRNCGTTNGSSSYVGPTCFTTPLTAPGNDDPCGAIALNGTNTPLNGSNVGSTTSTQNGINLPACSPAAAPKDVWFTFTATGTSQVYTFTGNAAGMVRLFTATNCSTGVFTQRACFGTAANTAVGTVTFANLTVGTQYYVAVSGFASSDAPGAFTITRTASATHAQMNTEALVVYPNPSNTGQLTLRLSNLSGAGQLSLHNALGQTVIAKPLANTAEQTLSTRGLATGVYTLRVVVDGQILTRKVVLQ